MDTQAFTKAYERLNPAQKLAVDTIEGPVMVVAGPGTGKTQILTLRIANIIRKTDTRPENVLALTFTEAGARAMRDRLRTYLGQVAYQVPIYTFHEFAGVLIRQYPDAYLRAVGGRPASDLEKVRILESVIESGQVKLLRPHGNPAFYIKPIMSALALMKREYITPDLFLTSIQKQEAELAVAPQFHEKGAHKGKIRSDYQKLEKDIQKNLELLYIYRTYDAVLKDQGLYDFEDMIFETVDALKRDEAMLRDLQERYQYILADEQQDVNGSQNSILELLANFHDRPNLFVVGDEKQAIYRFQGASLENFLFFEEKFPHTKIIALTENYRSVQKILDLAHSLITEVDSPAADLRVPLVSSSSVAGDILEREYSHESIENESVVAEIKSLVTSGIPSDEIAVIVRSNREVEQFASALRAAKVPVAASADGDILAHPITTAIRTLLTVVLEVHNQEALCLVLHAPYLGLPANDLVKVLQARSFERNLFSIISDTEYLKSLNVMDQAPLQKLVTSILTARSMMITEAPHRVLQTLLQASGLLEYAVLSDPGESSRVVRRLYDEVEALVLANKVATLSEVGALLDAYVAHGLAINAPYINSSKQAVQVMTAHKSKGLEFAHVFIPHLTDARWGDRTRPTYFQIPVTKKVSASDFDELDDERKLLYVACTRAKIGLCLSYSTLSIDGRLMSRTPLLTELVRTHSTIVSTTAAEQDFLPTTSLQIIKPTKVLLDMDLVRTTLIERGLSATALNNYLRSPWNYFYRNVLKVPELKNESALFGTVLHSVLRRVTHETKSAGVRPSAAIIKTYLDQDLARLPLSTIEFTRLHERGLSALLMYLDGVGMKIPKVTAEEVSFTALLATGDPELSEVLLTGNLDRLDYAFDGTVEKVVDYKSGKPKTRGYIEGTVKDGTGDYKRQLTFYALLLSLQPDTRYHTRRGLLSFVEPDEKGKIHEEEYEITDEEIRALKDELIKIALEIYRGDFLESVCDPDRSAYCELVAAIKQQKNATSI